MLAVLLLPALAAAQDAPASVSLQPDWEPGQTARYRFNQTRQRTQQLSAGGEQREATTTTEISGEALWQVQDVQSSGAATCTLRYAWLRSAITGPDGQQRVADSRQGSGDIAALQNLLSAMAGATLKVTIADDGTVQNVTGGEAIRSDLENPSLAPNERDLRRTAQSMAPLPAAPARIDAGGAWAHAFTESHPLGLMHFEADYEVAGLETIASIPIATLTITADMQLEPQMGDRPPEAPDVQTQLLDSNYRSQVIFDLLRREAVGRYTRQRQVIEQTLSMRGRTMTQRVTQQVESDLLRIDEGGQ